MPPKGLSDVELAEFRSKDAERKRNRRTQDRENEAVAQTVRQNRNEQQRKYRAACNQKEKTAEQRAAHVVQSTNWRNRKNIRISLGLQETATRCHTDESLVSEHYCGKMDQQCSGCGALHYEEEKNSSKRVMLPDGRSNKELLFSNCCQKGKVKLEPLTEYPNVLKKLMTREDPLGENFMENIRSVNSSFAFASMGANIKAPPGHGPYCFRIHGTVCHRTGTLHPAQETERQFGQLFILDSSEANAARTKHTANRRVNPQVFSKIHDLMIQVNPFAKIYLMMHEVEQQHERERILNGEEPAEIKMAISTDRNKDPRRYNDVQAENEVGIVFQTTDGLPPTTRDLIIHSRPNPNDPSRGLQRLHVINPNIDPMTYPIFFPYGEQGWGIDIDRQGKTGSRTKVTNREYLCHRLATRPGVFNPLHSGGKLFQEYCVISYVMVESGRLDFLKNNQAKFRTDTVNGLRDYIAGDENTSRPGQAYVLPSSFPGGPRYMQQNYQDAMAIVTKYGRPDLFVTMTCNPKWREIQENLEPWQSAEHRPDLIATVFEMKLGQLLEDITKPTGGIFGKVVAYVWVIEFQKRGLPHAHMLLILEGNIDATEKIDAIVSAEIPSKETSPRLYEIVTTCMIHRKCGRGTKKPCMKGGICTKSFPKPFQNSTTSGDDGYARYKRRKRPPVTVNNEEIDNSWVVPYNPYLLLKYNCHINVEVCASIKSVKYLYKYIFKGHDCADVKVTVNEIESYVDCRYVSAPEAVWRIFGYTLHAQSHSVDRLPMHLEGEQRILFQEAEDGIEGEQARQHLEAQLQGAEVKHTMLTAYFELNKVDAEARQLFYYEIPTKYVWVQQKRIWKFRQRCFNKIGRMYALSPKTGDVFYLRLLLLHVKGAISFQDLRTFNGIAHSTFKDAAKARGLLLDDDVWRATLQDSVTFRMPAQLRAVFAFICVFGEVTNPSGLWNEFEEQFQEDYCHKIHNSVGECIRCNEYAIRDVRTIIYAHGVDPDKYGLPKPCPNLPSSRTDINVVEEKKKAKEMRKTLNREQKHAFKAITKASKSRTMSAKCFFLDGPGGSGKTYLYKVLTHYIRGKGQTVLAAATTGIAANLLEEGRTLHSMFKLQLTNNENTKSNLTARMDMWKTIQQAALIIVDECTMASCHHVNAIDDKLREIMELAGGKDFPFGGKVVVFGGDFRQCLSIVPHAPRAAIVQGCLKSSKSWQHFTRHSLTSNMRCPNPDYNRWLLSVGNGDEKCDESDQLEDEDLIAVPSEMLSDNLVKDIFGESISMENVREMSKKAILCPKNSDVDKLNTSIMYLLKTEEKVYLSSDSKATEDYHADFTTEFLNSLTLSGMPPHRLILKVGAVVMLLRNLNTKEGLCNGTRLVVTTMRANVLEAEVLTGSAMGHRVMIPRIDITNDELGFTIKRRQFPVKVAFAMTINKSQGQTLDKVGIYLREPVFGHGQLYVGLSRVRKPEDIKIQVLSTPMQGKLIADSNIVYTKNVVYKEVLTN